MKSALRVDGLKRMCLRYWGRSAAREVVALIEAHKAAVAENGRLRDVIAELVEQQIDRAERTATMRMADSAYSRAMSAGRAFAARYRRALAALAK